ncbi:MAG: efflux RND transporter periplasmic adaptor subunit, partial [Thermoanaerobaculia bacterium]
MFRSKSRRLPLICAIALVLVAGFWIGCRKTSAPPAESGKKILYWVDPMHPQYKSDKPGKAPDCGMDLAPVYADEAAQAGPASAPAAATPVAEIGGRKVLYWYDPMAPGSRFDKPGKSPFMDMQLLPKYADEAGPAEAAAPAGTRVDLTPEGVAGAGVQTARVEKARLDHVIRAVGTIEPDERKLVHIASRVPGRLDRLYLNFTGEFVRKGAPIFKIYSPDLITSQRELMLAAENLSRAKTSGDPGYLASAESLVGAVRQRLSLWGLSEEQIDRIERQRKP